MDEEQAGRGASSGNKAAEIMHLATAGSEVEGQMWASALRNEGVAVLVRPGGPGAGAWASSATFEHALYVRKDDLETAREVLAGFIGGSPRPVRGRRQAPHVRPRSLRKPG